MSVTTTNRRACIEEIAAEMDRRGQVVERLEARNDDLTKALRDAERAIAEFYRYHTGGETRGSYDGRPEREGLWKAMRAARSTLAALVPAPQPVGEVRESQAEIDVLAERRRQVEAEGWTPEHDDTHAKGEMLTAAWCYIQRHADKDMFGPSYDINSLPAPARWPWDLSWWKPTNRRRDLVKAGALILAEIERLDRAAPSSQAQEDGR